MSRVVTCVSRGFIKWRYNAELSVLFRQLFNFHWIPPGESFTSFIIILPIPRKHCLNSRVRSSVKCFSLIRIPALLCGSVINFLSERGRKHFSIRDEAPLDPELEHLHHLLQRSRIYPGFTPNQLPDKNCPIQNQTLIEISVFKI